MGSVPVSYTHLDVYKRQRMVMYLTGVSNIRDVELHPRTVGNADF